MKRVAILGSTGSIGQQALQVIERHSDKLSLFAISAGKNYASLREQALRFNPQIIHMSYPEYLPLLRKEFPEKEILTGNEGLSYIAGHPEVDILLVAIPSPIAIEPTIIALRTGKRVALAAKEVLVCGGELVMREVGELIPVDSEHSAVYQLLRGEENSIKRIILTASGGPFLNTPLERFPEITPEEALKHPTWHMGKKITIDSATLFNKGLEIIEAKWLFNLPLSRIDVIVHPQSIIHSLVEFEDGSIKAHLSFPDMRLPIQYALLYPQRFPSLIPPLDFSNLSLTFLQLDERRFPAVKLCREAGEKGGTYPAVLCGADEAAVDLFLRKKIKFVEIPSLVERALTKHEGKEEPTLEDILQAYEWAKEEVLKETM
ncbi:1-deoxy-D-xylulose-5-phosphate reductoisomerase [bacterium]|nr:1-deoxy-D-xylulose-5-phosphate reductoisomerase [bacterium]